MGRRARWNPLAGQRVAEKSNVQLDLSAQPQRRPARNHHRPVQPSSRWSLAFASSSISCAGTRTIFWMGGGGFGGGGGWSSGDGGGGSDSGGAVISAVGIPARRGVFRLVMYN